MAGVLTGYNGSFEFKEPGQAYGDTPYTGMRVVSRVFRCSIAHIMKTPYIVYALTKAVSVASFTRAHVHGHLYVG